MQNPWLFYILSPNKNTYIRHLHPIAAQIFHFAYSHGEKQKRDFVLQCIFTSNSSPGKLCFQHSQLTQKHLPGICPLPFRSQTVYTSWTMVLFYAFIYLMQTFIEAHPVLAAKAWMEKMKEKNAHTHRKKERDELWVPMSPTYFAWYNFDGKCIRVVHPAHKEAFGTMAGRHCGETFR